MRIRIARLEALFFYVWLAAMMALLFYNFNIENKNRIETQNRIYAEDAARQVADKVTEKLVSGRQLIKTYAYFLERDLTSPEVTESLLKAMERHSPFDAIRFTDEKGVTVSSGGDATPGADMEFAKRGMRGMPGVAVVFNSERQDRGVLGFYAPVRYEHRVIGVLHGSYITGRYLNNLLEASYFGEKSEIFFCDKRGRVIASSRGLPYEGDILTDLERDGQIDARAAEEGRAILLAGGSGVFDCGEGKVDNLCVFTLPGAQFAVIQAFPKKITSSMIERANRAGIRLEAGLFLLFAAYVAFLIWRNRRQKKALVKENREYGQVLKAVNQIFASRYCMANLANGAYEYVLMGSRDPSLAEKGSYADYLNHFAKKLSGGAREEFERFFAPDNLRAKLTGREFLTYELTFEKNGRETWENLIAVSLERQDGVPSVVLFMSQDVTEMKERELEASKKFSILDRKERQYSMALTSNAFCSFEFNVSEDVLESDVVADFDGVKRSLIKTLGLTVPCPASEFFKALSDKVLPESRAEFTRIANIDFLKKSFADGRKEVDLEYWSRDGRKGERCVRATFYLTADEMSGNIIALVVARDITEMVRERRRQTKALKDALALAQRANEAKTSFLSNMSHDIRTPMNAIIGFSSIALERLDNKEQARECLQKVLSSSNHLLSLINDILDMSRIESGKMHLKEQDCNISELIHNLVTILQPQAKAKRMRLFIDTYDVINEDIIADPLKLNQVFINLLSNAIKYTPAGGNIEFRMTQKAAYKPGFAEYVFVVRDNGVGMSPEFVKHIFEPFTRETTTTLSGVQGTGLGMAITRNIIELMNGTIKVDSEQGKGSTFTVTLTFKIQDKESDENGLEALAGTRALVVDDDMHVCDSVDKMLKKLGMRAEWTTSGREAIYRAKIAKEEGDPYQTYILDWQMPELSGVETARQIRRIADDGTPVIILTAYEWADIEDEAKAAGVSAFCAKPLFMSDLRRTLIAAHGIGAKEEKKEEERPFKNARILIVDDVEMNREIAEFILSENGFATETAADGTDAVELVRKSPEGYYDAILMDVQMPIMDGYEATREIKSLPRNDVAAMPIIAMTANAFEEDKAAALKAGMSAHIAKPIDIEKFFEVLRKYFSRDADA